MVLLATLGTAKKRRTGGVLEHLTHALTGLCGTLQIVPGTNLLLYSHALQSQMRIESLSNVRSTYLLGRHWTLVRLAKLLDNTGVPSQILLATNEDDGKACTKVHDLGNPLRRGSVHDAGGEWQTRAFSCTLSSESGESTAKQMRMTCESG